MTSGFRPNIRRRRASLIASLTLAVLILLSLDLQLILHVNMVNVMTDHCTPDDNAGQSGHERRRPNIILIITDQERSHKHWPPGWAEQNLPAHYDRLVGCKYDENRSSVSFPNAFTATTECSPSRASLLTSSYPTEHGVKTTPGALDPRTDVGVGVAQDANSKRPNLMRLLSEVGGYDVAWKGKWHLSPPIQSKKVADHASLLKLYGATTSWNPPDAGHSLWHSSTLGGGRKFNHDGRFLRGFEKRFDVIAKNGSKHDVVLDDVSRLIDPYIDEDSDSSSSGGEVEETECILDFLAKHKVSNGRESRPFFLIASLVNPHDVWASSQFSELTDDEFYQQTGYCPLDFEKLPIELPPNHEDDLETKPTIQRSMRHHPTFGDLSDSSLDDASGRRQSDALRYVRFYAHLHKLVDAEIASLLDAVNETGKMNNTVIIRMADHGELALSHGLREKRMQCYEETMGIPLVINYPSGCFEDDGMYNDVAESVDATNTTPTSTRVVKSLVSSVDILPTIAEMVGVDCSAYHYRGKSLVPILRGEEDATHNAVQQEILFTFDEPLAPPEVPGYVRCIRTSSHKYAVYFTIDGNVMEYECYNLEDDPFEMKNLCLPNTEPDQLWLDYHERLTKLMVKMGTIPSEFDWEVKSKPKRHSMQT